MILRGCSRRDLSLVTENKRIGQVFLLGWKLGWSEDRSGVCGRAHTQMGFKMASRTQTFNSSHPSQQWIFCAWELAASVVGVSEISSDWTEDRLNYFDWTFQWMGQFNSHWTWFGSIIFIFVHWVHGFGLWIEWLWFTLIWMCNRGYSLPLKERVNSGRKIGILK